MNPHLAALHDALRSEERHAAAEHRRLLALPFADRVGAGVSWPLVRFLGHTGRWGVEVRVREGGDLHDGIGPGDLVWLGPKDGSPERGLEARVVDVEGALAELDVQGRPDWEGMPPLAGTYEVRLLFDPTTFVRFRQALERADEAPSPLREFLLDPGPVELPAPIDLPGADDAQRLAAAVALRADPVGVVHGPPGTGKTWLLARVLERLVAEGDHPWALADSNAAVDHLALAAAGRGLRVLRLGRWERMSASARSLSLREAVARGPFGKALEALDRDLARSPTGAMYGERRRLRRQAREHAIDGAEVLAVTFGTLARLGPELPGAGTAVVDEATQAIEPAVWTAVPHVRRLVLVGDPHQLGPVVTEPGNPLEESLLLRLLEAGVSPAPLHRQYRMHAAIQRGVEDVYDAAYRPAPGVGERDLHGLAGVVSPLASPMLWIDTAGAGFDEARDPVTRSIFNTGEAALVGLVVGRLRAGVDPGDIGVIAPYSAQVARLRALPALAGVEVATVNAFQGRETEVIVATFVRANPDGDLGFVADPRRLTVALTRARRAWVGIGDSATLGAHPRFAALFDRLAASGELASVWEPPWSESLDLAPRAGPG